MHLRLILQQPGPVLLAQLLLLHHHLDIALGMMDLGGRGVDLGVEVQLDGILGLLGLRVAREVDVRGLHVELDLLGVDVRHGDGQEDVVLFGFGCGAALGPGDCWWEEIEVLAGEGNSGVVIRWF